MLAPNQPANTQSDPAAAHCVGGLHEVCVGVPDLELAAADFAAYGCRVGERGQLDATAARALYGVDSAVRSLRLLHQQADHGLVRLMQWAQPLNDGLGLTENLRCVGSRWGVRVTASVFNIVNHAERARQSGQALTLIEPLLAVIGEVSGTRAATPFRDPIVGVREMVLLQPCYRQVFFERFGYQSLLYGQIDPSSLLQTSQHTHFGLMIADDDPQVFDFYDGVLGLKRMLDERTPYENATGSRRIFGLEPDEGFHMVDFDDPSSGHALAERRSGKLKCVRFAAKAKIAHRLDRSRAGCLGYSLYCWRVDDIERMHNRVAASKATGLSKVRSDEFGRRSFTFFAPDGYQWMLLQA
ncbi:MAG: VOC family protein [Gammaproteobacteria bacterium]|nr:VOC family protein [Gammaproteobacteria bacterium]